MYNIKKNLNKYILLFFILIIIISISYILKYTYDIYNSKKENTLLNETVINENLTNTNSLIKNETENQADNHSDNKYSQKSDRILKVEQLQKENPDIVAWIEIENTDINYPVVQGTDNSYYMKHNYKKQYSINGSIFLDKSYSWNPPDSNLLIYGHNNKNGTMFQNLLKYKEKNYYNAHPTIRFTTNNSDSIYEIFSVFESRVYYKSEQNVFRYYYFINSKNEADYTEYVNNAKQASLYETGKTAKYNEQLLTLSTCSYHTTDGRFAVVAKKLSDIPSL